MIDWFSGNQNQDTCAHWLNESTERPNEELATWYHIPTVNGSSCDDWHTEPYTLRLVYEPMHDRQHLGLHPSSRLGRFVRLLVGWLFEVHEGK